MPSITNHQQGIPDVSVVDREDYICSKAIGERVLSLGHSGAMATRLNAASDICWGVDKKAGRKFCIDLDKEPYRLADLECDPTLVVCGEVLEHLSNPGNVLDSVRGFGVPVLVTVPNAFSDDVRSRIENEHREGVNPDHVAYYSYWTMRWLLERSKFEVTEFHWYEGRPLFAEGLIMFAVPRGVANA